MSGPSGQGAGELPELSEPPRAFVLQLPDGREIEVDGVIVLGRAPEAAAATLGGIAVTVADPGRSVSRVHVVVEPSLLGAHATDAGSGNGTIVQRGDAARRLVKGDPFPLAAGDLIRLGDAVVFVR